MVLSLSSSFQDAASQGGQTAIVLADFDLGGAAIGTYRIHNFAGILSGHTDSNNAILSNITNISRKVDPVTRKTSSGTMTLEIVDEGTIRNWAGRFALFNSKVHIKLGFDGMATGDYLTVFVGVISEILPGEGVLVIRLADEIFNLERRKFGGQFINKHPLEVASQLIQHGAETTSLTSADFDPTNYSSSISHFSMTSVSMRSFYEQRAETLEQAEREGADTTFSPIRTGETGNFFGRSQSIGNAPDYDNRFVSVRPILDEIAQFVGVTFYVDESGSIRAKVYDSSTASVRTLTNDDYDILEQKNSYGGVVNRIIVKISNSQQGTNYSRKDSASITAVGEKDLKVTASHLAPVAFCSKPASFQAPGAGSYSMELDGGMITGFSGVRGTVAVVNNPGDGYLHTPATDAALSGSRIATFAIAELAQTQGSIHTSNTAAVINYHGSGLMERVAHFGTVNDDGSSGGGTAKHVQNVRYTLTCTAGGTISSDEADDPDRMNGMEVIDCSIISRFCDNILTRFSRGGIVVEFRTSLRHIDLQLGDFIEFNTDTLLLDGADFDDFGITVTAKFEIIEKELDLTSDVPSIKFTVCQVTLSTAPTPSLADVFVVPDLFTTPIKPPFVFTGGGMPSFQLAPTVTTSSSSYLVNMSKGIMLRGDGASIPTRAISQIQLPSDTIVNLGYDTITGAAITIAESGIDSPRQASIALIETGGSGVDNNFSRVQTGLIGPSQVSSTLSTGMNRVKNGGFEAWSHSNTFPPDGWTIDGGTWNTDCKRASETLVSEGRYCVDFPSSSSTASVDLVSDLIPVGENEVYLITADMRKTSGSPSGAIKIKFYNHAVTALSTTTLQPKTLTTSYLRIGGSVATPANARFAQIILTRSGASTRVLMDDVRMEIGSPMFSAHVSGDIAIGSSTQQFDVVFNTEIEDRGAMYDNSTGIATAPISGDYLITSSVRIFRTGSDTDTWQVHLVVNGSSVLQFGEIDTQRFGSSGAAGIAELNVIRSLEAGDTFKILCKRPTSGNKADNKVRAIGSTFSTKLLR